ncbi:iron hydrogenase small subunit [Candidatus Micrarchaeota archaeon]|nr:iron hydrogenase small subunit [Candidatus Micrarchaeota archaeon]
MHPTSEELFGTLDKLLKDKKKVVAVQIAPASRVSLGEEFGAEPGTDFTGKTICLLKKIGFKHVFDTPLGADLVSLEAANHFKEIFEGEKKVEKWPLFNSCCIGWVLYARLKHRELIPQIEPIVSPQQALGVALKKMISKKMNVKEKNVVVVSLMPCTMKIYETEDEYGKGLKYVDYVITTRELGLWARKLGIKLDDLKEGKFDDILGKGSENGSIFGTTGGITEAAVECLGELIDEKIEFTRFRTDDEIKRAEVRIGDKVMKIAAVHGLLNFEKLMEKINNGEEQFHFVEVMSCKNGCVGGPGQPLPFTPEKLKKRSEAMRKYAEGINKKTPLSNPEVKKIYSEVFGKVGSAKVKKLFNRDIYGKE